MTGSPSGCQARPRHTTSSKQCRAMADDELQAAEAELAEQLRQHNEALQGVRDALSADAGNAELIEVHK